MATQEISTNDVSPEQAVKALEEILNHLNATSDTRSEIQTDTSRCPSYLLDWNYDDTWEAGNENGKALEAELIQNLIKKVISN